MELVRDVCCWNASCLVLKVISGVMARNKFIERIGKKIER